MTPSFRMLAAGFVLGGVGVSLADEPADKAVVVPVQTAPGVTLPESANPTVPTPAGETVVPESPPCDGACGLSGGFDWSKHPRPDVFPRLGSYYIPGTGPGYYSAADCLTGNYRPKPPAFPYPPFALTPPSNFNNDFRYLDKPDNTQTDFFDVLKRMHPTPDTMLTIGGQHSIRFMNEDSARLSRRDDNYFLYRNRVYGDFWYKDFFRVYAEFIQADSNGNDLPLRTIDRTGGDMLNLFVDAKVGEIADNPVYVRAGRQELLYGSQRLVSTLDWANTRRTFEGVKAFWHSDKLDVDGFWTRPVAQSSTEFDSAVHDVSFYGAWLQYRPKAGVFADLYYLGLEDDRNTRTPFSMARTAPRGPSSIQTFGARIVGNEGQFLYDAEGMLQTGKFNGKDLQAYAWTAGIGWEFKNVPWRPQLWAINDYASGTANPRGTTHETFQPLFPFGHYYLGFADLVGRQNINDFNLQLTAYPDNWITLIVQYHHFTLAERRDFLYNDAGLPTRRSPTGRAGTDVGDEFDFRMNFHLSQHSDVLIGYSKLFAGDFIRNTGPNVSPEVAYLMYNFRW